MRHPIAASLVGVLALAGAVSAPAFAQSNDSAYVRVFDDCTYPDPVAAGYNEESRLADCAGYEGWTVHTWVGPMPAPTYIAYSDRGVEAQWQEGPPNLDVGHSFGDVMEWRLDASGAPFATILRSVFTGFCSPGQYLTVTALRSEGELGGCQVAYIEAVDQANPNQMARDAADYLAPGWECGVDLPITFDEYGESDVMDVVARRAAAQ
jgi:hypothetical protein